MSGSPVFGEISVEDLHFDPENPRLPETLDSNDRLAVLEFMLEDAGLIDLMASIAKQGFFPGEPMLVAPAHDDGRLIVVEGNRRFASALLLAHPDQAPTKKRQVNEVASIALAARNVPSLVPCLSFTAREDILAHLGYRHVTGIKEWEPLAKARFLHQMFQNESGGDPERFKSLARSIGSRSDYVGRLLTAYELFKSAERSSFYQLPGVNADSLDFSLLTSLLAYSSVVDYLGLASSQDIHMPSLNAGRLEFLTRFVFHRVEGRTALGESRNIRTLADVLEVPRAREALESGTSLSIAAKLTEAGAQAFRSWIAGARENLNLALDELSDTPVTVEDVDSVAELVTIARTLESSARERLATIND